MNGDLIGWVVGVLGIALIVGWSVWDAGRRADRVLHADRKTGAFLGEENGKQEEKTPSRANSRLRWGPAAFWENPKIKLRDELDRLSKDLQGLDRNMPIAKVIADRIRDIKEELGSGE